MPEIRRKMLTPSGLKVAAGRVEAAFSVFGNLDSDGDIVCRGAIENGTEIVISSWNHGSWQPGALPLGRGRIHVNDTEAVVDARMFSTTSARETLEVLDGLDELGRWSFAYNVLESGYTTVAGKRAQLLQRLHVHEASPCLVGANDLTRTLRVSRDGTDDDVAREFARFVRSGMESAA